MRAVIRFLYGKGTSAAKTRGFHLVYGPTIMTGERVKQWCRDFINYRTNEYDDEQSGSIQTDEMMNFRMWDAPLSTRLSQKRSDITNSVQAKNRKYTLTSPNSKKCAVDERFWSAIKKME